MKANLIYFSLVCIIFISACSKTKYPRVEYKITSSSSAFVSYTMVTGSLSQESVSGSWSKSFKHSRGGSVLLQATNTGLGATTISIYSNKKLLWTESTSVPGETIRIFENLP